MPEEQSIETLLASIWNRRDAGIRLPIDTDVMRPISREEVEYVCNQHYPYLQLVDIDANFSGDIEPVRKFLPNGWVIYDYGVALCTSFSTKEYFRQHGEQNSVAEGKMEEAGENERGEDDDDVDRGDGDGGDGGDSGSEGGFGTIIKQQFDTVYEMLEEIKSRGWAAVEIVAGTKLMQFYAWVAAQELGISLYGFMPTNEQQKQYQRIANARVEKKREDEDRDQSFDATPQF